MQVKNVEFYWNSCKETFVVEYLDTKTVISLAICPLVIL